MYCKSILLFWHAGAIVFKDALFYRFRFLLFAIVYDIFRKCLQYIYEWLWSFAELLEREENDDSERRKFYAGADLKNRRSTIFFIDIACGICHAGAFGLGKRSAGNAAEYRFIL